MSESRDCRWLDFAPDYRGRLQQFTCAEAFSVPGEHRVSKGGRGLYHHPKYFYDYELEVQSRIRDFRRCTRPDQQWARICVSEHFRENESIMTFSWFGIVHGTKNDGDGSYSIGFIARDLQARECHFGDAALKDVLRVVREDSRKTGRKAQIGTLISPANVNSQNLFRRNGFEDYGEWGKDHHDEPYHRWVRFGLD